MLLSINETKVAEMLKSSSGAYAVNSLEVPMTIESTQPQIASMEVSGIVYAAPALMTTEIKERLIEARHEIELSGVPLQSAEDLTKEIDDIRSRR